ncbi:hypothetical protein [Halosimplex sp. J119]
MEASEFPVVEAGGVAAVVAGLLGLGGSLGLGLINVLQFVGGLGGVVYLVERGRAALSN